MELFVDNFAGGGGASTGIETAIGRSVDIAINHDKEAIAMHKANHPKTKHFCEDVWAVDPKSACEGNPVALAWFSPDCTHFSRAKGGKPVDKKIRGLAWVTVRWAHEVRPRVIMLENVPEIQTWGPLGEDNKPIKERAGETFEGFVMALTKGIPKHHPAFSEMCSALEISENSEMADNLSKGLGYDLEYRILKSCDYGAPTTRTRIYIIARSDGKKIIWPEATHAPKDTLEVAIGEVDEDAPELKLSIDSIYGDFATAEYLGKILEKLNPQRQTNLPDFKGIVKVAFKNGTDFCDYCSSTNYCADCIVNEWKEEEMRADG